MRKTGRIETAKGRMAILVGGGPAPGINGVISGATTAGFYAVLYVILHSEDYALLMGSLLLLIVLAVMMFVTRDMRELQLTSWADWGVSDETSGTADQQV